MGDTHAEMLTRRPAAQVAPFVERYVGYRMTGFPAGLHRGLPSRYPTFIVSIGAGIDVVAHTDAAQAPARYGCVLSGLQASTAMIAHHGNQEGVAVELTPVGFRALFGMPTRALWNTTVELADVTGAIGTELWERLQVAVTWPERFAVCDDVLGRLTQNTGAGRNSRNSCNGRDNRVAPEIVHSWDLLVSSSGNTNVADLATAVQWSRQHLTRRFRDELGLSPKLAGRVIRFERARRMLQAAPSFVSIAQVAATCGYYDQAHLTNDFVELAGCTPSRLLVEEGRVTTAAD